jgi:ferredoxin/flavodoxin---NADP+ reductase
VRFPIVHKRQLSESVFEMGVTAPDIASKVRAGQFLVLRVGERGERIPLTFSDWDQDTGIVRFIFMTVGKTTRMLASLEIGDHLRDLVGPLGVPTEVEGLGRVVVVGGGVGAAVAYPVARAMLAAGNDVTVILGARNESLLILREEFEALGVGLVVVTDDGSAGRKALVTVPLKEMAEEGMVDHAMAIGPAIMMKFCAATAREHGVPVTVSLNPIMVDGTGMCGACRVTVGGTVRFACVHGPDFDGAVVDFEELMNRQRVYSDAEREADTIYQSECARRAAAGGGPGADETARHAEGDS